jgi:glucose-6-phosphate isomerase
MSQQPLGGAGWAAELGDKADPVRTTLVALDDRRFMARLWAKEPDLWKPADTDQSEIVDRLGWLDVATAMRAQVPDLTAFAEEVRGEGFRQVLLLGMGGSSLAPEVLHASFGVERGFLDLRILDSTNPASVQAALDWLDLPHALFLVSSKSGGTIEVMSFYHFFHARVAALGGGDAGRHFVAVTDPGTSLERLAAEAGFRRTFINPPDIGGRYSVLSFFGLVPAALLGLDITRLLDRALAMQAACGPDGPASDNPGAALGVILGELAKAGRDKLTLVLSPAIRTFGSWVEQLIAESTGKEGTGILPVDGEPLGTPEVYGQDRVFVHARLAGDSDGDEALAALAEAGHPVVRLDLADTYDLGAEFYRWEMATAVAGALLGINAFDQPNVQESKDFTGRFLAEYRQSGRLPSAPFVTIDQSLVPVLRDWLGQVRPGDYIALNAYLQAGLATDMVLHEIRHRLRDRLRVATTVGYGPRFLHSTGQFHKGGPPTGLFLQITAEPAVDLPIPGQPYTFATLQAAQALGDWEALVSRGRRALRVHLAVPMDADLQALHAAVEAALAMD